METASAEEFTQQARAWYLFLADGQEVVEECEQPHGFGKFGHIARDFPQQWFGIFFHYAKFKQQ